METYYDEVHATEWATDYAFTDPPGAPVSKPTSVPYFPIVQPEDEYKAEILEDMYEQEERTMPSFSRLIIQDPHVWRRFVESLIKIHMKFDLDPEVLYLAMNIVNRYLSLVKLNPSSGIPESPLCKDNGPLLSLPLACAALWIADKLHTDAGHRMNASELACTCGESGWAWDIARFKELERHIDNTLDHAFGRHPTAEGWLRFYLTDGYVEESLVLEVARFFMEMTLFHVAFASFKPSVIASAVLYFARWICEIEIQHLDEFDERVIVIELLDQLLQDDQFRDSLINNELYSGKQVALAVMKQYKTWCYSRPPFDDRARSVTPEPLIPGLLSRLDDDCEQHAESARLDTGMPYSTSSSSSSSTSSPSSSPPSSSPPATPDQGMGYQRPTNRHSKQTQVLRPSSDIVGSSDYIQGPYISNVNFW